MWSYAGATTPRRAVACLRGRSCAGRLGLVLLALTVEGGNGVIPLSHSGSQFGDLGVFGRELAPQGVDDAVRPLTGGLWCASARYPAAGLPRREHGNRRSP